MRYRKMIAAVGLVAGLGGAEAVAAAPSLVIGSTATAGAPMICWDTKTNTFCENQPPVRPPLTTTTTTATDTGR